MKEKAEGEIGAPRRCGLQTLSIIFAVHLNKGGVGVGGIAFGPRGDLTLSLNQSLQINGHTWDWESGAAGPLPPSSG